MDTVMYKYFLGKVLNPLLQFRRRGAAALRTRTVPTPENRRRDQKTEKLTVP